MRVSSCMGFQGMGCFKGGEMKRYIKQKVQVSQEDHMKEYVAEIIQLTQNKIDAEKELMDAFGRFPQGYTKEVNVEVFEGDPLWDEAFVAFDPIGSRGEVEWIETK